MSEQIVDAREFDCPMPMLLLQKALRKKGVSCIHFLMAQTHKQHELESFLSDKKYDYSIENNDLYLKVLIQVSS